jgi:hypothetical protein
MKTLKIAGRIIKTERIEMVRLPNAESASVWLIGRADPLTAHPDEIAGVHRYVATAMNDDGVEM